MAHPLCSHPTICQGVYTSEKSSFYHLSQQVWLQLLHGRGLGDLEQSLHGHCCWEMSPPPPATPQNLWPGCFEKLRLHQNFSTKLAKAFAIQEWEPFPHNLCCSWEESKTQDQGIKKVIVHYKFLSQFSQPSDLIGLFISSLFQLLQDQALDFELALSRSWSTECRARQLGMNDGSQAGQ